VSAISCVREAIGRQLRCPSGLTGAAVALGLAAMNRGPNRAAIEALNIAPDDTVIELGYGPGRAIAALTSMVSCGRVLGIDHSAAMFTKASRHNRSAIRDGRAELQLGRFDALPWQAGSIDKVLAVNVAYFFAPDGFEIREARRVLRPGGTMAIYATHKSAMACFKVPSTHRLFDANDLATLIMAGGFAVDEITIEPFMLAFGVLGLLAVIKKSTTAGAA
jgi:ubiquinone/menaquinone biosynthesis C-methylase UbiE